MPFGWGRKQAPPASAVDAPALAFASTSDVRNAAVKALSGRAPIVGQSLLVHWTGPSNFLVTFRRSRVSYSEIAGHCGQDLADGDADIWISQTIGRALRGSNARYGGPERADRAWALLRDFRFLADPANAHLLTTTADIDQLKRRPGTSLDGLEKAEHEATRAQQASRAAPADGLPSLEEREASAKLNMSAIDAWEARVTSGEVTAAESNLAVARIIERAVRDRVCLAVRLFGDAESARAYVAQWHVPVLLDRLATLYAGIRPTTFSAHAVTVAYGAALAGRASHVPNILEQSSAFDSKAAVSRFWQDHHRALACLVSGSPYEPDLPSGMEAKLPLVASHLMLIAAVTTASGQEAAKAAATQAFTAANSDRRRDGDFAVTTIYPTRADPVRFDLASWAIPELARRGSR